MNKIYYERPQRSINKEKQQVTMEQIPENRRIPERPKKNIKDFVMDSILIVLSIVLAINLLVALNQLLNMGSTYTHDEDDFWRDIDSGCYSGLIEETWHNRFCDVHETEGLKQCYGVAEYFEAAALYKVALHVGNEEMKEKYSAIMEKNIDYFYDIMYIAEDIHEKLGIE